MNIIYPAHQAKAKFSEVLRHVREGKTITISYRGEPVAELRPLKSDSDTTIGPKAEKDGAKKAVRKEETPEEGKHETMEERLADFERRGILVPSGGTRRPFKPVAKIPGALERFLADRG